MNKKVAIVGASGYSGEELLRLLLSHPQAELTAVTSRQYAGHTVAQVFPKFASHVAANALRFTEPKAELLANQAELVFLALPHGLGAEYAIPLLRQGCRVIDLSADFRLKSVDVYKDFYGHDHPAPELLSQAVYGLPEIYRAEIKRAQLVASPGCYPTSILLPTIPLLRSGFIRPESIIADSLSGVSGAGRKAELDYLFCECNESVRPYGVPKHRHLSEIEEQLSLVAGTRIAIQFTPHLIPVNRGILTTIYCELGESLHEKIAGGSVASAAALVKSLPGVFLGTCNDQICACYEAAYAQEPFVRLLKGKALPDTKNVAGTNVLEIAWRLDPRTLRLIVMSAEDNLVKGASGQAVQNMNIMCGFPETAGLM
jgi:N-acetyl-gamma-glutamyl-phosphate reductase